ncbi:MAG: aldo/keto reductase [Oscillibacter sp.]|nr:aldo/keto reductase [Oscillibacter sp.]
MIFQETYTLSNGVSIPKIALGTWQVSNDAVVDAVKDALSVGYRHVDTAVQYENEEGIGKAIRDFGIARNEVFVTTKIPHDVKTYEGAKAVIEESLDRFGFDYLDMILIHSPKPWPELFAGSPKTYFDENLSVWNAMTEAYHAGKIRAIGVSNFEISDMQNLLDRTEVKPMVNQVRVHIGHTPSEIIRFCRENGLLVEAYSPNATGKLMGRPEIAAIAEKYGVTVPQLSLRYDIQLGVLPMPKTTHREHMIQNAKLDFVISAEDMASLGAVEEIQSLDM